MTNAERAIRWSTVSVVALVAVAAGWVSLLHAMQVARTHGETGAVAWLYPATVDGLIYAASMVLLDAARRAVPAPALARWMLAAGIGATVVANVWSGVAHGVSGALVAAWPALALVGAYETLMVLIRAQAADSRAAAAAAPPAAPRAAPAPRASAPQETPPAAPSQPPAAPPARAKPVRHAATTQAARRAKAERLLRANPAMPRAEVVKQSGVSERTADRIRGELPRSDRMTVVR